MVGFRDRAALADPAKREHTVSCFGGEYACGANEIIKESVRGEKDAEQKVEALMFGTVVDSREHARFAGRSFTYIITLQYRGKRYKALFKTNQPNNELRAAALSQSLGMKVTPLGVMRTLPLPLPQRRPLTGYLMEWIPGKSLVWVWKPEKN